MKKIYYLIFPILLHAISPFETSKPRNFDLTCFNTKETLINKKVSENEKIKCRYVCDKKIYVEQKIAEAISYYKGSKEYSFK